MTDILDDDKVDDHVDDEIRDCLSLENPGSFFMFAGAGAGKTRSLERAISSVLSRYAATLQLKGQYVGVITYTNAACDEIGRRVNFNATVKISTIHSFVWSLIEGFNDDIKQWLRGSLAGEISELEGEQARAKGANKTFQQRARRIESKQRRLATLGEIKKFTYSPDGDNLERDSLNHSEVIGIAAHFLRSSAVMQQILISRFPILLIDESQDTNGKLMEAFMEVQKVHAGHFSLGLFGDTMQRIYNEGLVGLEHSLPADWEKPVKVMNHRCPKRIVDLINEVRLDSDGQRQRPRSVAPEGIVRLFIISAEHGDRIDFENWVADQMGKITEDPDWDSHGKGVKRLILEHKMAAHRMGFLPMFEALSQSERLRTGLLKGTLPAVAFFSQWVLPLIEARERNDDFAIATVLRKHSPLLSKRYLAKAEDDIRRNILQRAAAGVEALWTVWQESGGNPSFVEILNVVQEHGLLVLPRSLQPFAEVSAAHTEVANADPEAESESEQEDESPRGTTEAIGRFLETEFAQLKPYVTYVEGTGGFGTHQGVKGLQFPRVMVIMDDSSAGGFLFSYEKLFGAMARTKADLEKEAAGEDTGIARTKRLFYVTCSRAEKSLALVAYSKNPQAVKASVIANGWFTRDEIVM